MTEFVKIDVKDVELVTTQGYTAVSATNVDDEYRPITPENAPVSLSWRNLIVATKSNKAKVQKQLLNNLSGNITGGFWSIMGSSGSGKTTFLSALALRLDTFRMNLSGEVLLNGKPYGKYELKSMSGYVMQDDLVHSQLTIGETLSYTARLRLANGTTAEERAARIDEVLNLMHIAYARDVIVGDSRFKGISGGERKRLCIAIELLTKPKLLFLDEPTSGLDSTTALIVCKILKDLSNRGECTVVTTVHQPQTKIFNLFDNLILMRKGDIVYQGSASKAVDYFEKLGYPFPEHTNPADHLIDVISEQEGSFKEIEDETKGTSHKRDIVPFDKVYLDNEFGGTSQSFTLREWQPWYSQFVTLFIRNLHFHWRSWHISAMNLFVTLLIATFTSMSVWRNLGTHKAGSTRREPLLFFCVIHQGIVASLQGSHSFPLERSIMLRERQGGSYYVSAYFLAKSLADALVQSPFPIVFTCVVYPITGLQNTARKFFIFLMFMVLDSFSATSLANMISCIFVSIELSTVVLALSYEWVRLFGGWFISPGQIALYPKWRFADVLSYIKYAFVGVSLNENHGLQLTCLPKELVKGKCTMPPFSAPFSGHVIDAYYGYDRYTIGQCAGFLVAYILCCRFAAYLGLRFIKV
eukprot:gene19214-25065_t